MEQGATLIHQKCGRALFWGEEEAQHLEGRIDAQPEKGDQQASLQIVSRSRPTANLALSGPALLLGERERLAPEGVGRGEGGKEGVKLIGVYPVRLRKAAGLRRSFS
jgi:hypothetical protein